MQQHPLEKWTTHLKEFPNQTKQTSLGMFIVSASSIISECMATTGLEWLAVDMEASPATRHDLIHIAQSLNGSNIKLFVRVAENHQQFIEAALDSGAHGVIVPKVSTREEALNMVNACFYPPMGTRGLNPIRCSAYFKNVSSYLEKSRTVSCIAQIETKEAIDRLEEIVSVEQITGLFVGCGDLAMDYGIPFEFEHPLFEKSINTVLSICKKYDLLPGIFAYSEELAKKYMHLGFKMIGIGNEIKSLRTSIEASLHKIRGLTNMAGSLNRQST